MSKIKDNIALWLPADYCVAGLLLTFTAYNRLMPLLIILWAATLFFKRNQLNSTRLFFSWKRPAFWFVIFFCSHLIGLVNTENYEYAFDDIGMKASFVLLPLIIGFTKSRMTFSQIADLFLWGLFVTCSIAYSYAIFRSIYNVENNHWAYFTESYLSFMMHRSYFATYLAIGSLIAIHRVFDSRNWLYILFSIVFAGTTILTFSKAGILLLFIAMTFTVITLSIKYYSWKLGVLLSGLLLLVLVLTFLSSKTLQVRFGKMIQGVTTVQTVNNPTIESSASRAIMWSTSVKLIKENPFFGVGTGDVSDELDKKNLELGNTGVAKSSLNSHDQYLNTGVQLGVFGVFSLLMIFAVTFIQAYKASTFELFILISLLFSTLLFESFLETQAGIIPVTLLILLFSKKSEENEIPHSDTILSA